MAEESGSGKLEALKGELKEVVSEAQVKDKAMMLLDYKIKTIHDSTRTDLAPMSKIHNSLRMNFPWYYNWHISPWSSVVHRLILLLLIIAVLILIYITRA